MNEFLIKNGLIVSGSTNISGSITALSFIGSLSGSASTASYVNPLTQSLLVSGSATFTDTLTASQISISGINNYNLQNGTGQDGIANTLLFKSSTNTIFSVNNVGETLFGGTSAFLAVSDRSGGYANRMGFYANTNTANLYSVTLSQNIFSIGTTNGRITLGRTAYGYNGNGTTSKVTVLGEGTTSATTALLVQNANASSSLVVLDNGSVGINVVPSKSLHINGDYRQSFATEFFNYYVDYTYPVFDSSDVGLAVNQYNVGTTYNNVYTIRKGNFAVGTTSLIDKFTVSGSSNLIGNTKLTGSLSITGSLSTSSAALTVYKSGSTTVDIQGSQGQLFSIIDSLSGSLMSVNDVSGLPILEVFSNDTVVMGTYGTPAVIITGSIMNVTGSLVTQGQVLDPAFIWFMS